MRESVCAICHGLVTRSLRPRISSRPSLIQFTRISAISPKVATRYQSSASKQTADHPRRQAPTLQRTRLADRLRPDEPTIEKLEAGAEAIASLNRLPTEAEINDFLTKCEEMATLLTQSSFLSANPRPAKANSNAADALLPIGKDVSGRPTASRTDKIDTLSDLALQIMALPTVFITESLLRKYTNLQLTLNSPERIPYIFTQFANKPTPITPTKSKAASPNAAASAIPRDLAFDAMKSALRKQDMDLCVAVIESSTAAPAYRTRQLFTKALPPGLLFGVVVPGIAFAVANEMATWQLLTETSTMRGLIFGGIMTYLGCTATLGYIAITTRNDQMRRVSWFPGTPLYYRWLHEDERAMCDMIAEGWGFRDEKRWGEERGKMWDELRIWLARKDMRLDYTPNLKGME